MSFKSEVCHSAEYPEAALRRIGEVEDAKIVDKLITSASITGQSIPDFENPDKSFKEQVTNAEGKAQSEKVSLTGTQIAWMICDFSQMIGDDDAILDDRDLPEVQLQNDTVQDKRSDISVC